MKLQKIDGLKLLCNVIFFGGLLALTMYKIQAYNKSEVFSTDKKQKKSKSFFIRFLKSKNPVAVKLKKFALSRYLRSIEDEYIHQPFYKKLEEKMEQKKSKKFDMSFLHKIEKDSKKNQDIKNDNTESSDENFSYTDISFNNIDKINRLLNKKENKETINYDF